MLKSIPFAAILWIIIGISTHVHAQIVYFGNLHAHTGYSDGSGTPEEAYLYARDIAGLDFMAITEHNHKAAPSKLEKQPHLYNGGQSTSLISTAKHFAVDGEFVAIYGQEFSSIGQGNHANILEIGEVILPSDVPNGQWDKLLLTWLPGHADSENKPAIMLLNHPAISSSPNNVEYGIDDFPTVDAWRSALDKYACLMNIVNGPSHEPGPSGTPSESEFLRYLNLGLHVAPTADQDNHLTNWGNAADTRTGVIADALTKNDILTALRQRHVYASEDRNLEVIAHVNGSLMGTIFNSTTVPAVNSDLSIVLKLNDPDEPYALYTINVYADDTGGTDVADVVAQFKQEGDGQLSLTGLKYTGKNQYLFIKITQTDGDGERKNHVWTAPVWFEPSRSGNAIAPVTTAVTAVTLEVDLAKDEAKITNVGNTSINLKDWTLVSLQGNQRYVFQSRNLAPRQSLSVLSGPNARPGADTLVWGTSHIWSNSGDPAQLFDKNGQVIAEDLD